MSHLNRLFNISTDGIVLHYGRALKGDSVTAIQYFVRNKIIKRKFGH